MADRLDGKTGKQHGRDYIEGNAGDDKIYGGKKEDWLYGNEGEDTIWGGAGEDYLHGNEGDDRLYGDDMWDYLYGGEGNDYMMSIDGGDKLWGGPADLKAPEDECQTFYIHGTGDDNGTQQEQFSIIMDFWRNDAVDRNVIKLAVDTDFQSWKGGALDCRRRAEEGDAPIRPENEKGIGHDEMAQTGSEFMDGEYVVLDAWAINEPEHSDIHREWYHPPHCEPKEKKLLEGPGCKWMEHEPLWVSIPVVHEFSTPVYAYLYQEQDQHHHRQ